MLQAIGYSTEGFKIIANAHFSEFLNETQIQQLEAKLRELTGVMIEVGQTGKLIL